MIVVAIKNNASDSLIEVMRKSADIPDVRLAELKKQAQMT